MPLAYLRRAPFDRRQMVTRLVEPSVRVLDRRQFFRRRGQLIVNLCQLPFRVATDSRSVGSRSSRAVMDAISMLTSCLRPLSTLTGANSRSDAR